MGRPKDIPYLCWAIFVVWNESKSQTSIVVYHLERAKMLMAAPIMETKNWILAQIKKGDKMSNQEDIQEHAVDFTDDGKTTKEDRTWHERFLDTFWDLSRRFHRGHHSKHAAGRSTSPHCKANERKAKQMRKAALRQRKINRRRQK
jgi:hypothetical protein